MRHLRSVSVIGTAALLLAGLVGGAQSQASTLRVASSSSSSGTFGDLGQICGPGHAKGATAQGVTDSSIEVGTITDIAFPADPGLFKSIADSAAAFTAWCNKAGGINGRKIKDDLYDAKGSEDAAVMLQACQSDFALVGDLEVADATGLPERLKCKLPELPGGTVSDAASSAPLRVSTYPSPATSVDDSEFAGAKHMFPKDTKVGFLGGNIPSVEDVVGREAAGAKELGFSVVYNQTFPETSGLVNPQSYVLQAKAAGVQVFSPSVDPQQLAQLEQAMNTIGWHPAAIVLASNLYDPATIQAGGSALQNTWAEYTFRPFQDPNAALTQYESIVKAHGGIVDAYGVRGFAAWLLFAEAAKQCGSNLTRSCLLSKAASEKKWNDGGIGALTNLNPVGQTAPVCNVAMKATPTGWKLDPTFLPPTKGQAPFNCNPNNVQKI
jgi:hypothetical protein